MLSISVQFLMSFLKASTKRFNCHKKLLMTSYFINFYSSAGVYIPEECKCYPEIDLQ